MQNTKSIDLPFDAVTQMQRAVDRELRRKKALGQYAVVWMNGKVEKINFGPEKPKTAAQNIPR